MTSNKGRKRLVRQRSAKTGESYAAALRQLRASKEISVTTPDTCHLCDRPDGADVRLLRAGKVPVCRDCHERFMAVLRTHLEPVADEHAVTLESVIDTLAYDAPSDDARWYVHLHTFRPGLVIGKRGVTAQAIRDDLVALTGDERFRLNIVEHGHPGCFKRRAEEPTPAPS
jgi:hypothetical protein